ncbi:cyclin-dependent kinase inhibitor 3 isoform X3 [Onychomys torridus]|uniref:cyclin-dependent kinase inhibitor 3 isoform X3 n=1 Tax=Onychomys torridus TaxID=38674 RepID=UPI00167F3B51|nr:cyclin-dependent kinase inhibitor 3 isoform X3 [Onychomys torridus]
MRIYSHATSFCFFWDIFFFCATSSSGFGTMCSFSVRIISMWQGELLYGLVRPCNELCKSALFLGHRPCVQPHCLAWAHLPTPPLYRQKGTHCFFKVTSFSCYGGLGRSCLVAACLLLYLSDSVSPQQAIDSLRDLRGSGAIQTIKQYNYLHEFRDKLAAYLSSRDSLSRSVSR